MKDNAATNWRNPFKPNADDAVEAFEDLELPSLDEKDQQCYARTTVKPVYSIHFLKADGTAQSCQYINLSSPSEYRPGSITLHFLGMSPITVTIQGRNLWRLYDLIHQHRMPWLREAIKDFAADGEVIVTQITIENAQEPAEIGL